MSARSPSSQGRRLVYRCEFCGAHAAGRLPAGLYAGWLTCGRAACGVRQLPPAPLVRVTGAAA